MKICQLINGWYKKYAYTIKKISNQFQITIFIYLDRKKTITYYLIHLYLIHINNNEQ